MTELTARLISLKGKLFNILIRFVSVTFIEIEFFLFLFLVLLSLLFFFFQIRISAFE